MKTVWTVIQDGEIHSVWDLGYAEVLTAMVAIMGGPIGRYDVQVKRLPVYKSLDEYERVELDKGYWDAIAKLSDADIMALGLDKPKYGMKPDSL